MLQWTVRTFAMAEWGESPSARIVRRTPRSLRSPRSTARGEGSCDALFRAVPAAAGRCVRAGDPHGANLGAGGPCLLVHPPLLMVICSVTAFTTSFTFVDFRQCVMWALVVPLYTAPARVNVMVNRWGCLGPPWTLE